MIVVMLFILFLVTGCTGGLLEEMDRTNKDPFDGGLHTVCFEKEGMVSLSWEEDPGTDEYLILRGQDSGSTGEPEWKTAYRGRKLSWTDKGLANDERRIYTLQKKRGKRFFRSTTAALGVGSEVIRDIYEPNDSREWAKELTHVIEGNVQHYRSYNYSKYGKSLEYSDTDWYYVRIPTGRKATITLTQKDIRSSEPINLAVFSERASRNLEVESGVPFTLENREIVERTFRFRIKPTNIFGPTLGAGGKTVSYELKLDSISILTEL
ncbi:hypothetical protein S1OALGB6SA_1359 [Olavius algarvensis spirochete endosymbiont]|uniref:hypothetical protein n=1 Tax=Olavius algarvensis spirochete endosymbiont TaxID=260710 RepID=UPI000F22B42C|nr:hypothetical protein [Olavius algarvensis spirochete endosymbiont]VDB00284.1 hypothetical protein S1OALGB6SA_1359 [Olavius algarvensis spirochete endosymbiont]